ncbi:MAG: hypothetical protein QOH13_1771 [Thermoleophilaceae bacterium]|nr:hypothetical protein [Thermoleophilaceae bacterium]
MRATKAYIASLGTTGVLLGASLLMLAVVSAVVAFDRWPNGNVSTRVQTLVLADRPAPIRVSASAIGASATPALRALGVTGAPRAAGGAPNAAVRPFSPGRGGSPAAQPPASNPLRTLPPAVAGPLEPVQQTGNQIIDSISNPGTTAGAVADGAQGVTDAAGVSVGRINPQLGGTVAGAGQTAAQTVRDLPLPQHLLPGH